MLKHTSTERSHTFSVLLGKKFIDNYLGKDHAVFPATASEVLLAFAARFTSRIALAIAARISGSVGDFTFLFELRVSRVFAIFYPQSRCSIYWCQTQLLLALSILHCHTQTTRPQAHDTYQPNLSASA